MFFWYNNKYERCGHLFQERFKSENVETARYFLTVLRYIHQNPVKAGLAANVFQCKWTSIDEYLQQSNFIDTDLGFNLFSPDRSKAIKLFAEYMQVTNDDECLEDHVRVRISDSELKNHLVKIGVPDSSTLQQMKKEERNAILLELKGLNAVTIRQLARITGISNSVIDRIR
ncbi:hypothetical protein [Virgibacillus litoralis]|uniref:Uncharacterized protein n=1 Tax=Virgibacillus litoralis TaxID=578221 RepID=A0ABS4HKJ5_9BACI|nr:hypothetical protein [Virgibacillus litoralis]MBP1950942.1 hypothetical protein [Virgibacillus litoralis]